MVIGRMDISPVIRITPLHVGGAICYSKTLIKVIPGWTGYRFKFLIRCVLTRRHRYGQQYKNVAGKSVCDCSLNVENVTYANWKIIRMEFNTVFRLYVRLKNSFVSRLLHRHFVTPHR